MAVTDRHVYSRLSIEKLARLANLSLSSFKREFRRVFNDSPAHYLKHKKLERARQLLEKTDRQINKIAFECGFEDFPHFCRSFVRHAGLSLGAYRLQKRARSRAV
jgi:transcriptional regulator GlxA family with amidase domain